MTDRENRLPAEPVSPAEAASPACEAGYLDGQVPELDVRPIPHAFRPATVFGALGVIPEGGALVVVAPQDPVPLLEQIADREGGAIEVSYLEQGPNSWRVRLARRG
jgi:uncharacterized protein (DUF2249 family)